MGPGVLFGICEAVRPLLEASELCYCLFSSVGDAEFNISFQAQVIRGVQGKSCDMARRPCMFATPSA